MPVSEVENGNPTPGGFQLLGLGHFRRRPFLRQPLLAKCEQDRANVRAIKLLNTPLSEQEVEMVIDDLLVAGQRILTLENKAS